MTMTVATSAKLVHLHAIEEFGEWVAARVRESVEEETVALVAALGGAIEQIKAHGGEPSHNAITVRDQVIARIRNGGEGGPLRGR